MAIPDVRSNLVILPDAGETWAFYSAHPANTLNARSYAASSDGTAYYNVACHSPDKSSWATSDYLLHSLITYQGDPSEFDPVPVLGLLPDTATGFSAEPPLLATYVEGVLWMRVLFDATIQRYRVWYAVYGWTSSDGAKTNSDKDWFATYIYDDATVATFSDTNWWVVPQHDVDFPVYSKASLVWLTTLANRIVLDNDVPYLILDPPEIAAVQGTLGDTCCVGVVTPTSLTADSNGYLPGNLVRYNANTKSFTTVEACLILNLNP